MNLIDPRMMDRFVLPPVPPIVNKLSTLDSDMKSILERDDISVKDKVSQYNQVLHRYLQYYANPEPMQHQQFPPSLTTTPTSMATVTTSLPKEEDGFEKELESVIPISLQRKAKALLQHIRQVPNISWSDKKEFVVDGKKVDHSHMLDLINHALRSRKKSPPVGTERFAHVLKQSNVPQELIGNPAFWRSIRNADHEDDSEIGNERGEQAHIHL